MRRKIQYGLRFRNGFQEKAPENFSAVKATDKTIFSAHSDGNFHRTIRFVPADPIIRYFFSHRSEAFESTF